MENSMIFYKQYVSIFESAEIKNIYIYIYLLKIFQHRKGALCPLALSYRIGLSAWGAMLLENYSITPVESMT